MFNFVFNVAIFSTVIFLMYFTNKIGKAIPKMVVKVQIIFHEIEHSIPPELNNACIPINPIAVNPGMKIPITEKIIVGFKKSKFLFFNSLVFIVFSASHVTLLPTFCRYKQWQIS